MKSRNWLPEAALLGVAFIWGGGFVASKVALEGWNITEILFLRFGCAALFQALLLGKSIRKSSLKTIGYGVVTGLLFMGALCFQLSGLKYTSSAKSGFICGSYAALVPFINWGIQRIRPRYRDVAAGILAVTGIGILSLDERLTLGKGEFLSVFFTILYGVMIVLVAQYSSMESDCHVDTEYCPGICGGIQSIAAYEYGSDFCFCLFYFIFQGKDYHENSVWVCPVHVRHFYERIKKENDITKRTCEVIFSHVLFIPYMIKISPSLFS